MRPRYFPAEMAKMCRKKPPATEHIRYINVSHCVQVVDSSVVTDGRDLGISPAAPCVVTLGLLAIQLFPTMILPPSLVVLFLLQWPGMLQVQECR